MASLREGHRFLDEGKGLKPNAREKMRLIADVPDSAIHCHLHPWEMNRR